MTLRPVFRFFFSVLAFLPGRLSDHCACLEDELIALPYMYPVTVAWLAIAQ